MASNFNQKTKTDKEMNESKKTKSYNLLTLVIWVDTTTLNAGPIGADFSSSSPTAGSFWRVDLMSWKSTMSWGRWSEWIDLSRILKIASWKASKKELAI